MPEVEEEVKKIFILKMLSKSLIKKFSGGGRGRGMHRGGGGSSRNDLLDSYGNSFGSKGIPENSYILKNDFRNRESSGPEFLVGSLFNRAGMQRGWSSGGFGSFYFEKYGKNGKMWNEEKDQNWRKSTRAPYFENKIPEEDKILPASAVIGEILDILKFFMDH